MTETLQIAAQAGPYTVHFRDAAFADLAPGDGRTRHVIIDERVRKLHAASLGALDRVASVLEVEANETSKTLDRFTGYVEHLVGAQFRRDHILVAVGGGVIQDITAFLAATMMRGVQWEFHPTTLLAQADSCIGSKSSINVGGTKNIMGTFHPPARIDLAVDVLETLDERDIRSGVGEMIKAHVIAGPERFDRLARDLDAILADGAVMKRYIFESLDIKKEFVEADEFDRGRRNIFNYGHSFGHAIEAATDFAVPHGIAVAIGMDMANFVATRLGRLAEKDFERMHEPMTTTYRGYETTEIPMPLFLSAISRDKKNVGSRLTLILPDEACIPEKVSLDNNAEFESLCRNFLDGVRAA